MQYQDEAEQPLDENSREALGGVTVELKRLSPLEILDDVQQILVRVTNQAQTDLSLEEAQIQTKTALNLVLRAISELKRQERRK